MLDELKEMVGSQGASGVKTMMKVLGDQMATQLEMSKNAIKGILDHEQTPEEDKEAFAELDASFDNLVGSLDKVFCIITKRIDELAS